MSKWREVNERREVSGGRRLRTNWRIKADPESQALRFAPIIPTPGKQKRRDLLKILNLLALNIKFQARQDKTVKTFTQNNEIDQPTKTGPMKWLSG